MRVFNSIVAIVFCDSRCLSDLTPVNIGTCYLLGHSYRGWWSQWWQWLWLMEGPEFNGDNFFCNSWRLSVLAPVISCPFWWNFVFVKTEGEFNGDNSFLWFLTLVNIDLLSFRPQFSTENGKCSSFDEILYCTWNEGGESMISILTDAMGAAEN